MQFSRVLLALLFVEIGCQTQTIEYRSRPSWQTALSSGLHSEQVREDGTIMKYSSANEHSSQALQEYLNSINLEETDEFTGERTLRAVLPDHVLMHLLTCLRDRIGEIPISGFFAAGEIGPIGGTSFLHGHTACLTLFRTSKNDA